MDCANDISGLINSKAAASADKVVNDHDGMCSLEAQRTPQSYHTEQIQNPDGTITWTSRRTGRTYTTHPYNHRAGP